MPIRQLKPSIRKPPRESTVVASTTKLSTKVTKEVTIEVPSLQLRRRHQTSESTLITRLSNPSNIVYLPSSYHQNIKFLAHGDHLHALAGCNSIHQLMSKGEYKKFRAWADRFFDIKPTSK